MTQTKRKLKAIPPHIARLLVVMFFKFENNRAITQPEIRDLKQFFFAAIPGDSDRSSTALSVSLRQLSNLLILDTKNQKPVVRLGAHVEMPVAIN